MEPSYLVVDYSYSTVSTRCFSLTDPPECKSSEPCTCFWINLLLLSTEVFSPTFGDIETVSTMHNFSCCDLHTHGGIQHTCVIGRNLCGSSPSKIGNSFCDSTLKKDRTKQNVYLGITFNRHLALFAGVGEKAVVTCNTVSILFFQCKLPSSKGFHAVLTACVFTCHFWLLLFRENGTFIDLMYETLWSM